MSNDVATVEYMARRCVEFDTVVAAAFRKALGLELPPGMLARRAAAAARRASRADAYGSIAECFANARRVRL